ncbi:MFS monocarboxylate [Mycena kentingensis (nom. inval.)]|nr:MFS monocarboxylate [Mycena kentingensis (nom. inval.)]
MVSADGESDTPTKLEEAPVVPATEKADSDDDFPDGGFRAWATVLGAFMVNFSCYGVVTSFGVFQQYYSAHQLKDQPPSNISWIGSLQLSLVLLLGCISGPLFDAGYLKSIIASAGSLYVFSLFMTSISTRYYQFVLSHGLGVGIAMGMLYSPSVSTIGHHFKKYRIMAFGVFSVGASVGGTILPIVLRRLFEEVGFAWAVRTLAFLVLFCMLWGFFLCSTRLPPRKGSRVLDFSVFHDRAYTLLVAGTSIIALGLYAPITYGVTYAVSRGMSTTLAFSSLSVLNALAIPGRILPNVIAQRTGPINALLAACLFGGALDFLWVTARSTAGIFAFNAAFGLASGGYASMLAPAVTAHSGDASTTGVRLGMAFFTTSFCWLASSPVQGALIRARGGETYWPAAVFSGSMVLLGTAFAVASRAMIARRAGSWAV